MTKELEIKQNKSDISSKKLNIFDLEYLFADDKSKEDTHKMLAELRDFNSSFNSFLSNYSNSIIYKFSDDLDVPPGPFKMDNVKEYVAKKKARLEREAKKECRKNLSNSAKKLCDIILSSEDDEEKDISLFLGNLYACNGRLGAFLFFTENHVKFSIEHNEDISRKNLEFHYKIHASDAEKKCIEAQKAYESLTPKTRYLLKEWFGKNARIAFENDIMTTIEYENNAPKPITHTTLLERIPSLAKGVENISDVLFGEKLLEMYGIKVDDSDFNFEEHEKMNLESMKNYGFFDRIRYKMAELIRPKETAVARR